MTASPRAVFRLVKVITLISEAMLFFWTLSIAVGTNTPASSSERNSAEVEQSGGQEELKIEEIRVEPTINSKEKVLFDNLVPLIREDTVAAIRKLKQATKPESSAALGFILGNLYFEQGEFDAAIREYENAIRKFPHFKRAYTLLGKVYIKLGKLEESIPNLMKAVELGAENDDVYGLLGYAYLKTKHFPFAESYYGIALSKNENVGDWKSGLAVAYLQQRKYEKLKASGLLVNDGVRLLVSAASAAEDFPELKERAEQGDAEAQFNIGVAYLNGFGVEEDDSEGFKWYREAAEQGNDKAQFNLGMMYFNGNEVEKDTSKASFWFHEAADAGNKQASSILRKIEPHPVAPYVFNSKDGFKKIVSVSGKKPKVFPGEKVTSEEVSHIYFLPQDKFAPGMVKIIRSNVETQRNYEKATGRTIFSSSTLTATLRPTRDYSNCFLCVVILNRGSRYDAHFRNLGKLRKEKKRTVIYDFPYYYNVERLKYLFLLFSDEGEIETTNRKTWHSKLVDIENLNAALLKKAYVEGYPGETVEPFNIHQVRPTLSDNLDRAAIEPEVRAEISLSSNGTVTSVRVLSDCGKEQRRAVTDALLRWKFFPELKEGVPVACTFQVEVAFNTP